MLPPWDLLDGLLSLSTRWMFLLTENTTVYVENGRESWQKGGRDAISYGTDQRACTEHGWDEWSYAATFVTLFTSAKGLHVELLFTALVHSVWAPSNVSLFRKLFVPVYIYLYVRMCTSIYISFCCSSSCLASVFYPFCRTPWGDFLGLLMCSWLWRLLP